MVINLACLPFLKLILDKLIFLTLLNCLVDITLGVSINWESDIKNVLQSNHKKLTVANTILESTIRLNKSHSFQIYIG